VVFTKDQKTLVAYPGGKKGAYTIPASVTAIGNSAFSWCGSLTSITIPNSVTAIGVAAFSGCMGLTSVTIPGSVTAIGESAFKECGSLTSVTIPASVTAIGDSAFAICSGLTSVTIPNSVTSIGNSAFFGCRGLTSVTIGSSVTAIGRSAFAECGSLTSVTFEGGSRISSERFANNNEYPTFPGDLRDTYLAQAGGAGTYTRLRGGTHWTKGGAEAERLAAEEARKAEEARLVAARAEEARKTEAARRAEAERRAATKGKSIAVLLPEYTGGSGDLAVLVQSALITDFRKDSNFKVLDRESLNRILKETMDPTYTDTLDIVRLGHVTHTDYILTGNIVKTSRGYILNLHIANTLDGTINASSSNACTLEALENLSGTRNAARELLPQLCAAITGKAQQEFVFPPASGF
jgi:TolB-like protein